MAKWFNSLSDCRKKKNKTKQTSKKPLVRIAATNSRQGKTRMFRCEIRGKLVIIFFQKFVERNYLVKGSHGP